MTFILSFSSFSQTYSQSPTGIEDSLFLVTGTVTDSTMEPIIGATVKVKGKSKGTVTDVKGNYSLATEREATLEVTYVGYKVKIEVVNGRSKINFVLQSIVSDLDEVVIVGYGVQKKASLVSAISTVSSTELKKSGGVPNLGMALTGKIPGVVTLSSTGLPGDEEPEILIRGRSTWHNTSPLILIDGIERPINSIDINEVESVTVLKDASATAVYGVRGANGVVLITTKRGKNGRAQVKGIVKTIAKVPSKLPNLMDSYEALKLRNSAIVNELGLSPESWSDYLNPALLMHYRKPQTIEEAERYPNVDWDDALFKDYSMAYQVSLSAQGGNDFVKYFASADYVIENDLLKEYSNDRGYKPGFGYKRLNVRSNLDFDLTPTTILRTNLAGSFGMRKRPWGFSGDNYAYWISAYATPPDMFQPKYSDGSYGYSPTGPTDNSVKNLANSGIENSTTTMLTTNFEITQNLDFILKGLTFNGIIAVDNTFVEGNRGINDLFNDPLEKYVDPWTGKVTYSRDLDPNSRFSYRPSILWSTEGGTVQNNSTYRRLNYQLRMEYNFDIGERHHFTEMGLFNRIQNSIGSEVPHRRENWIFRSTYNYDDRYIIEYNGSYNGSEKFSKDFRFGFFSSGGVSWNVSNEDFMDNIRFINELKMRASFGNIGDDDTNGRWLYMTQWAFGGNAPIGMSGEEAMPSPYNNYRVSYVGNPNVRWANVRKQNIGLDFSFLDDLLSGSIDFFQEKRKDVLVGGSERAIPTLFGQEAPPANLGKVENKGYELTLSVDKTLWSNLNLGVDFSITHSKNILLFADNPQLLPDYQKGEGKSIGQAYTFLDNGYYSTWDELYGTTAFNTNDNQKLPGGRFIVDYNGDGVIDDDDNIPYGYSGDLPENIFSTIIRGSWKRLNLLVQFYGVNNVNRYVELPSLNGSVGSDLAFNVPKGFWSKENPEASSMMPRWKSVPNSMGRGRRYLYDGSYLRLKNVQIAYNFSASGLIENLGISSAQVYVGGNDLFFWSQLPDDRETNHAGTGWASQGAYPTVKRYEFGVEFNF